jgi:hypothetical protein
VSANKEELEELEAKLTAILSIVQKYKKHDWISALDHRIETFCQCVEYSSCLYVSDLHR